MTVVLVDPRRPLLNRALIGDNLFRISVWNSQLELARAALQDMDPAE